MLQKWFYFRIQGCYKDDCILGFKDVTKIVAFKDSRMLQRWLYFRIQGCYKDGCVLGFKDVTKMVALPDKSSVIALIDVEKEFLVIT